MSSKFRDVYLLIFRGPLVKLNNLLDRIDNLFFTPSSIANTLYTLTLTWKEIKCFRYKKYRLAYYKNKALRKNGYLDFKQSMVLFDLRQEYYPDTLWEDFLRLVLKAKLGSLGNALLNTLDRFFKGWDQSEIWNLDQSMALRIGKQLLELAEQSHGWPESVEFPTPESWVNALQLHGNQLIAYATSDTLVEPSQDNIGGDFELPNEDLQNIEKALKLGAKEAYTFIANHHQSLWD